MTTKIQKQYHSWHARTRYTERDMTFDEFADWWYSTGHYDERGPGKDQYCMSRVDTSKPYTTNNVECITNRQRRLKQNEQSGLGVVTPYGTFVSLAEAHKVLKSERATIKRNCINNLPGWSLK